jgi:glutathione S-transferase
MGMRPSPVERMSRAVLFGAPYSVYVRAVRLVLAEKGVAYTLREVDIFAAAGPPDDYLARHPFGRIPAFEHDGFQLYESGAISRYVDEAFHGPALQPSTAKARARQNQLVSILDNYAYRTLVWDIFVERIRRPQQGVQSDEQRIAEALPRAATCLGALAALAGPGDYFVDDRVSLADLHAAPMLTYFLMTPEGRALIQGEPRLLRWWQALSVRPSMAATRSPMEV